MPTNSDLLRGLSPQIIAKHWVAGRRAEAAAACAAAATDPETTAEELGAIIDRVLADSMTPAFPPAIDCAKRLLSTTPSPSLYCNYAHLCWVCGHTAQAIEALHTSLRLQPLQPNTLRQLAMIELEAGQVFEAFRSSGAALALAPQLKAAKIIFLIAQRILSGKAVVEVRFATEPLQFRLSGKTLTVDAAHVCGHVEEGAELHALHTLRPTFPVMVDIGGNVGNHAAVFHRVFRPGKLFVYEVNPRCLPILEDNLALNRVPGCEYEVRPRAVGAARGKLFLPRHDDLNTGLQEQAEGEGESVDVVALDDELDAVDFLKIDVEGMELDVLKGAERLIQRFRPWILIESKASNRSNFDFWISEFGYKIAREFPRGNYSNIIAAPAETPLPATS